MFHKAGKADRQHQRSWGTVELHYWSSVSISKHKSIIAVCTHRCGSVIKLGCSQTVSLSLPVKLLLVESTVQHYNQPGPHVRKICLCVCWWIILPVWEGNIARTRQKRATSASFLPPIMSCKDQQMKHLWENMLINWMDFHKSFLVLTLSVFAQCVKTWALKFLLQQPHHTFTSCSPVFIHLDYGDAFCPAKPALFAWFLHRASPQVEIGTSASNSFDKCPVTLYVSSVLMWLWLLKVCHC